jgi:hypothetical protein
MITLRIVRGMVMNTYDADALAELKHQLFRTQQRTLRRANQVHGVSMTPAIKMLIGDWYVDELGVWTREVKARD